MKYKTLRNVWEPVVAVTCESRLNNIVIVIIIFLINLTCESPSYSYCYCYYSCFFIKNKTFKNGLEPAVAVTCESRLNDIVIVIVIIIFL